MVKKNLISLAVLLFLLPHSLSYGQSTLNFPRALSVDTIFTGFAVGNPTNSTASVTFSAFGPDGTLPATAAATNPVTISIAPGGQVASLFTEMFGTTQSFNGWVQATSSTSGLTGFFLNGNGSLTDLDGALIMEPAQVFVLPFVAADGVAKSETTIVNTNAEAATVQLSLLSASGSTLGRREFTIEPRALVRQLLTQIFPDIDLTAAFQIRVQSDRPVIGHQVVADYQVPGIGGRRESVAVAGQVPASGMLHALPQFVSGSGWISLLNIVDGSGVGQEITLTAYKDDGSLWDRGANPKRINLDANGTLRTTFAELFEYSGAELQTGWILIRGSVGQLIATVGYGNAGTPSFAMIAGRAVDAASRTHVYSHVAEGAGYFTGLSVINPGTESAAVDFFVIRSDGSTIGKFSFTVAPNERVGRLFRELLPASLDQVGGWALLRSSKPVVGTVLFGSTNGVALASVPQQNLSTAFEPAAQKFAAISGRVLENGSPVQGVAVSLAGPVQLNATTDSDGRYVFSLLPTGTYNVAATRLGAEIAPSQRSVELTLNNAAGVDFEAGGLTPAEVPVVNLVSPSSVLAGTGLLSMSVFGSNFTPFSVVRLNGTELQTTFVHSGKLQAVVPAGTLSPGNFTVVVATAPPGGGVSAPRTITVAEMTSDPLVEGQIAVGEFPAGIAIHPGTKVALVSNQGTDTVSVLDLDSMSVVKTIPVKRSPGEGIAIDPGLGLAVVANTGSADISVIDLATMTVKETIAVGKFPIGLGINTATHRVVVANGESDNVSIVDLTTSQVIATIAVGSRPAGVAVNSASNQAVVTSLTDNTATVIDLGNNTVLGTVAVGEFPRGVAIDVARNVAVVANANSASATLINLTNRSVIDTIPVGVGPTGVAIHEPSGSALVTNSGVTRGVTNPPPQTTVSVLNLDQREVVATIPVGGAAYGVAADVDSPRAIVANYSGNDVTVIRVPNPVPRVTSVEPKIFPASGPFTLTIRGTGFLPSSVVTLNGVALKTTFISSIELRAIVTTAILDQFLQFSNAATTAPEKKGAGPVSFQVVTDINFNVNVTNPGPGGGGSLPSEDLDANRIVPVNPVPVLTGLSPEQIITGSAQYQFRLDGQNFNATTQILIGASAFSPTSSTPNRLTVVVPGNALPAGVLDVRLFNPEPGGGLTSTLSLTVADVLNPVPMISSVFPAAVVVGAGNTLVTVMGSGFSGVTTVSLGGQGLAATAGPDGLQFLVPGAMLTAPMSYPLVILNSAPGGGTAISIFNVLNPVPVVNLVSPTSADAGAAPVAIVVTGSRFTPDSQILIENTPIDTVFVAGDRLLGTIPTSILGRPGTHQISVLNGPPGGGKRSGGTFTINAPQPILNAIRPDRTLSGGGPLEIQLDGSGFVGNSVVFFGGNRVPALFDSATQLTATIPQSALVAGGSFEVLVENPAPGGRSTSRTFSIDRQLPVVDAVTPARITADQRGVVLTVTGRDFSPGTAILLGSLRLPTIFVSATELRAPLPAVLPLGVIDLAAITDPPGGGTSNAVPFEVVPLLPVILSIDPPATGVGRTVRVIGTNFGRNSVVRIGGVPAASTAVSDTELQAVVPAGLPVGTSSVIVVNPGTGESAPVPIEIVFPAPVATELNPSSIVAGSGSSAVVITGSQFASAATVLVDGNPVETTFLDNTRLRFNVTAPANAGQLAISARNPEPGGGISDVLTLQVTNPAPSISLVSPFEMTVGIEQPLSVFGSGFVRGSVIMAGSRALDTTFVSGRELSTSAIDVSEPAAFMITVVNPVDIVSNSMPLRVLAAENPVPIITSVNPSELEIGVAEQITINGSGFLPGSTVSIDGSPVPFTFVSSAQLTANLPALGIGTHVLSVTNVAPGGGRATFNLSVEASAFDLTVTIRDVNTGLAIPGATVVMNGATEVANANGVVTFSIDTPEQAVRITVDGYIGRSFTAYLFADTPSIAMRLFDSSLGADSDGDGLPDSVETNTGIFLSISDTGTNPNVADSDGDGLLDGAEILDGPEGGEQ